MVKNVQKCVHLMKLNVSFLIKNDELLEQYNEIWDKFSKVMKNEFDSVPVYDDKYLETKIKFFEEKFNTNFHDHKAPDQGSQYICLSVNLVDSIFRLGKKYYPQLFLKEFKYVIKESKMSKYIHEVIEICSDESNEYDSDEESSDDESNFKYV